jgi:PAS domain S-box-containing protein
MSERPTYEELEKRNRELEKRLLMDSPDENQKHYLKIGEGRICGICGVSSDITERINPDKELGKTDKLFRTAIKHSPIAMVVSKGINQTVTMVSDRFTALFGYTIEDIPDAAAWWPLAYPDKAYREKIRTHWNQAVEKSFSEQSQVEPMDVTITCKDGTRKDVRVEAASVGEVNLVTFVDMTERKKVEASLSKSEALFRGLYNNMTSGSAIYEVINDGSKGSDYIIKNFNKKSLEIEGKTLNQVVGKSLLDLRPTIDDFGLIPILKKVWETGEPDCFPVKIYQDEMFSNYYENYIFKIPTGEVVTIYNDVTDQKNSEIALKESEERFALAMESTNDGLWDWNLETNEIYYSPVWKGLLGYEDHELPNDFSVWEKLTDPGDVKRSWEMQNELINKKRDRFELEFKMKHKDGHWVDILSRANVIFNEDDKAVRIVGTHQDITEKRQLEDQLNQAQKMESVGRLAGGVAHDFNNMLSVILGKTEMALEDTDPDQTLYADLKDIQTAARRSADVTRQLLAFARKQTVAPKVLNLNRIIKMILKMLRRLIGEDIDLIWLPNEDLWPVRIDPSQIDQILANLSVNARDAIADVGKLTIETGKATFDEAYCADHPGFVPGDFVQLTVSDNGCGMNQETLQNLFEPFYTTKDVDKGTGLGLATVYGIVKQNDGFINVYSELDQGTTFRIYLPRYLTETEILEKKSPDTIPLDGTEAILLVEDEPSILRMTRMMLERMGYKVLAAGTPGEAIALAREHAGEIHLLMTDVVMPEMNGRDLARNMLSLYPNLKRLFMSGYTANMIAHHGVLDEGVQFIQKPFSKQDLAIKVREVLDEDNP